MPCVLQAKKRYVGYMYETPEQKEPAFDAKGIETVRRDGCPAVAKVTNSDREFPVFSTSTHRCSIRDVDFVICTDSGEIRETAIQHA